LTLLHSGRILDLTPKEQGVRMSKIYSDWLGRQVVLQIETGESRVPLRGQVVAESSDTLRFRLDGCWDVDIYKAMILGVEAENYEAPSNWRAEVQAAGAPQSGPIPMASWTHALGSWCRKHSKILESSVAWFHQPIRLETRTLAAFRRKHDPS